MFEKIIIYYFIYVNIIKFKPAIPTLTLINYSSCFLTTAGEYIRCSILPNAIF